MKRLLAWPGHLETSPGPPGPPPRLPYLWDRPCPPPQAPRPAPRPTSGVSVTKLSQGSQRLRCRAVLFLGPPVPGQCGGRRQRSGAARSSPEAAPHPARHLRGKFAVQKRRNPRLLGGVQARPLQPHGSPDGCGRGRLSPQLLQVAAGLGGPGQVGSPKAFPAWPRWIRLLVPQLFSVSVSVFLFLGC